MGIISGLRNAFWIAAEKIKSAFVKVKNTLTRFFEKALSMMKYVAGKVAEKIRHAILGAAHFFRKVGNKYQEGTRTLYLEEEIGEWKEETYTREIKLEDIPPKYRTLDDEFEIDDTRELDAALSY